jgi:hypothetical protein
MLGQCLRPDVAGIDAKLSNALKLEAGTSGRSELASFSPSVGGLLSSQVAEDEREATMRECFSVAFDREVGSSGSCWGPKNTIQLFWPLMWTLCISQAGTPQMPYPASTIRL